MQQYFPGLQLSDFNIQLFDQNNQVLFASVQRKEQTINIIKEFKQARLDVADVMIGVPSVMSLTGLLVKYNYIRPNLAKVDLSNGFIEHIAVVADSIHEKTIIEVDSLKINADQLLSFAGAFMYLTDQTVCSSPNAELSDLKRQHSDKNNFKFALGFFVVLAFLACLTNFILFTSYFSQINKLDAELSLYQDKYDKINNLLTNYEKKKTLIEETGLLDNYFFSTYADKIAATIPPEVILTDLVFNPANDKNYEEDSLLSFNKNTIVIKGNCGKSLLINEWVNILKSKKFIKEVDFEKFLLNNDGAQPNFTLKLVTK